MYCKEEEQHLGFFASCEDCGCNFRVLSSVVYANESKVMQSEFFVSGKKIFLTYYDCPNCKRRHYVQVDDCTSLKMLKEVKSQFVKLFNTKRKGVTVPQKEINKFNKSRQDLSFYRKKLMYLYSDKVVHDNDTDIDFVLRFSV